MANKVLRGQIVGRNRSVISKLSKSVVRVVQPFNYAWVSLGKSSGTVLN